jgi:flagellar biosynthesis protein FliP
MGPNIDPCGTLLETSPQLDGLPITISLYIRLDSQFLIHLFIFLLTPICAAVPFKIMFGIFADIYRHLVTEIWG